MSSSLLTPSSPLPWWGKKPKLVSILYQDSKYRWLLRQGKSYFIPSVAPLAIIWGFTTALQSPTQGISSLRLEKKVGFKNSSIQTPNTSALSFATFVSRSTDIPNLWLLWVGTGGLTSYWQPWAPLTSSLYFFRRGRDVISILKQLTWIADGYYKKALKKSCLGTTCNLSIEESPAVSLFRDMTA